MDRAKYGRLRDAVIGVLDTMPEVENSSAQVDVALRNLRAALMGDTLRQPDMRGVLDPFEYSLAARLYVDRRGEPIPLPQRAADLRRRLDRDRGLDERRLGEPSRNVVITELRAMIVAGLLEELAARLSPGVAFGPGRSGEELARVAADLAKELLDQTFVGE
ncbi:hypothetical protein GCM10012280_62940 [Wenjunlia tyrosinilytica]|uniref:Uncharacterized protein n=1 Tax=Wenjunlia tyrosinilytica TaxID=1544741 RepID=A0A917ZWV1_9ACTN|nr:hypothetical protein GCM10012280_62940 [Wenjunlia tyrosinilytica]